MERLFDVALAVAGLAVVVWLADTLGGGVVKALGGPLARLLAGG